MPIYDFLCGECGHLEEHIVPSETQVVECSHCDKLTALRLPSAPGGYNMNSGSGSTRPKNAGSFKRSKQDAK